MVMGEGLTQVGLFPRFSDAEFQRRHNAVNEMMDQEGIDALVIGGGRGSTEAHYLINYMATSPCWLVWPRHGEPTVFLHFYNHIPCTREQTIIDDVQCYGPSPTATISNHLLERGLSTSKIGLVSLNSISYNHYMDLQRRLPEVEFTEFGRHQLRPGMSDYDIRSIIANSFSGYESDPGIQFIGSTNMEAPDRCLPWQRPTNRTITAGSVVITEITVGYWGYSTQIHRPFAICREPTPLYRELFDVALECYENVRRVCVPGATSEDIVAATSVIEDRGFTTYDSVFHGEQAKSPELGTRSAYHPLEPWTLRENMVYVIQPNPVTLDYSAGLQLGAAVVVKPDGGECLHNYPFKFPVCGF